MLPILASLALLAVGAAVPPEAGAHTCATPVEVAVGQPAAVTVGVAAEGATPVVGIDLTIPEGFAFDQLVPGGGWQAERRGDTLQLRGGTIAGGACGFLVLKGTATARGTLRFPMRTYDQDGAVRDLDRTDPFQPLAAMVVEARAAGERPGGDAGPGGSTVVSLLVIGAAVAVAGAGFAAARRNRARRGARRASGRRWQSVVSRSSGAR